jgi:PAS domain S-box-containing protein
MDSRNLAGSTASPADFEQRMVNAAIASAVNAIVIIDEKGRIQQANPATEKLFGIPIADLAGRNVSVLMPEPYHSAHDGYLHNYLSSGEKKIIGIGREVTGRRKDGTTFPMHLSVGEFEADSKRYFVGTITDISARAAAEAESARQKTFFEAIFDNCPDAMIISDLNRRITLCNPAASRIFGYDAAALTGKPLRSICAADEDYDEITISSTRAASDRRADQIITFARSTGAQFPGIAAAAQIIDANGASLGCLTVVRDVSREVAQEQALRKVQRMEALGQLTGGIAHDFNNLLTIITGNHELLELELTDEYQRDLLKRSNDAAMMGARLTDRLLTFARRRPLDAVMVNFNELLLGMMDLLRRTLGEVVSLTASLAPDLWPVRSDVSELENAVLNLAINARDAMLSGGRLMLETRNIRIDDQEQAKDIGLAPGAYVRLSVSDTGHGMSPEILARVFEPFYTTKQAGKGTGLGLSVIYGFAKQSGGEVTIYSEVGRGTTVNLYLPRALSDPTSKPRVDNAAGSENSGAGETVLVVEDQPPVREVTMRRIEQLGYRVLEADSVAAAIEILQSGALVDLVFSDVVMPGGKTGFDLAAWVLEHRRALPVVLTSGFAQDAAQSTALHVETLNILRKPYGRAELAATLREALDGTRG